MEKQQLKTRFREGLKRLLSGGLQAWGRSLLVGCSLLLMVGAIAGIGGGLPVLAADYNREFLVGQDFSGRDLTDSSFTKANLRESNFSGADWKGVSFFGADL